MAYYDILEMMIEERKLKLQDLKKLDRKINNEFLYSMSKDQIANALGISMRAVENGIAKLIVIDEIKELQSKVDKRKKYYCKK